MKKTLALLMCLIIVSLSACTVVYESKETMPNANDSNTTTDTDKSLTPVTPPEESTLSQVAAVCQGIEITGEQYYYFVYYIIEMAVSQYGMYLPYYGGQIPDYKYSLKEQYFMTDKTWYDMAVEELEYYLANICSLNKAANDAGVKLSDFDKEKIADDVKETKYPDGVDFISEETVTSCLSMIRLADKYCYWYLPTTLDITDDDIQTEYTKNMKNYTTVDMKYLPIRYSDDTTVTNADGSVAVPTKAQAQAYADRLIATAGSEEFETIVEEYLKEYYPSYEDDEIKHEVEASYMKNQVYYENYAVFDWAFSSERAVGDTICKDDDASDTLHVAVLLKTMTPDESETVSVRHILVSTEKEANDILALYEATEKKESDFADLAMKNTTDPGSAWTGGLYESFPKGKMVQPFEEWSFDEKRVAGDTGVVKTDYGYHVMYFVGKGKPAHLAKAKEALASTKTNETVSALTKDVKPQMTDGFLKNLAI